MRVLSVVGNRPQFIKSAPLSLALREARIDEVVVHTGQHYDPELSQVFFDELDARRRGGGGERRARARRGGSAELRPLDAGGAQPHRGRPSRGAPLLSG